MPAKDSVLSDYYRLKTLDNLLRAGVYVNDYPGFVLDRKDISYFYVRFPALTNEAGGRKNSKKRIDEILSFVGVHNEKNKIAGTDKEIKIFYLDD